LAGADDFGWPVPFWIMLRVFLSIRIVAGYREAAERRKLLVQNEEATLIDFLEKHTCTVTCREHFFLQVISI
jgi:hypothetical protein